TSDEPMKMHSDPPGVPRFCTTMPVGGHRLSRKRAVGPGVLDERVDVVREDHARLLGGAGRLLETREIRGRIAVQRAQLLLGERDRRATQALRELRADGDCSVRRDRHFDVWQPDAAARNAMFVAHDLGWITREFDARLRGRRRPSIEPALYGGAA